jgi:hypothetical protein
MLNDVMGKLATVFSGGSAAVVDLITAIAAAITSSIIGGTTGVTANRILTAKGASGFALQASGASADSSGNINTNGGDLTVDDITADVIDATTVNATNGAFSSTLTKGGVSVAIVNQAVGASFTFKVPENETVYLILNAQFQWTITQTDTITEVGTSTVTVNINGTPLGGTANSASTSLNTQTHATANVVNTGSPGNPISVTFTSTSSNCENLCLTIWGTRVLT